MPPAVAPTKFAPIELVSPKRGLTVILTPDRTIRGPEGAIQEIQRGMVAKFRDGRYTVRTKAEWDLFREHPAYTGGLEPRVIFTLDDPGQNVDSEGGVRVVTGAVSSSSGRRSTEPCTGYDRMTYAAIRKAVQTGAIKDYVSAITYEQGFKRRIGVIELFAAAIVAKPLPSAKEIEESSERGDPEIDEANPGDLPGIDEMDEETAATAAALAAREAIDEAIDPEHSEPAPEEVI